MNSSKKFKTQNIHLYTLKTQENLQTLIVKKTNYSTYGFLYTKLDIFVHYAYSISVNRYIFLHLALVPLWLHHWSYALS